MSGIDGLSTLPGSTLMEVLRLYQDFLGVKQTDLRFRVLSDHLTIVHDVEPIEVGENWSTIAARHEYLMDNSQEYVDVSNMLARHETILYLNGLLEEDTLILLLTDIRDRIYTGN